ncbi:hypothetical protein X943_000520 [Babesia divergens]|uniref:Uncharacterized protein n=1 Tax=Babesia divergens TaxID=32595 RepID=A0AAD9G6H8_BABDI|nr:hypothetical protein X943_000520 [Babesia divergens]
MKSRKRDSNINGRGIRRGSEAAIVKQENFYFREFDNNVIPFGIRRIRLVAESRPFFRPNIFVSPNLVGRLDTFSQICAPECIQLLRGRALNPREAVPEQTLKQNAEKIWTIPSSGDANFELPILPSHVSGHAFEGHVPHSTSTSILTTSNGGLSGRAANTNEKKSGFASLKALAERLKDMFMKAVTQSDLREIQGDELFIDGIKPEGTDDVFISTTNVRHTSSVAPTESDSSQNSSFPDAAGCRSSDNNFHKTATYGSGPDDINDTVSMSESPLDEEYNEVDEKNNEPENGRNADAGGDQHDDAEDMSIETSSQRTGASSDDNSIYTRIGREELNEAVRAHVNASKNRGLDTIGRYKLLNMSTSIPHALMSQSSVTDTSQSQGVKSTSSMPDKMSQCEFERDSTNVSIHHTMASSEASVGSQRSTVQTGAEILDLKSAHLIRNIVEVNPSKALAVLRKSNFLVNSSEGLRNLYDDTWTQSSGDESKPITKPSEKKHAIALRHNEMQNNFLDGLQKKRKTKYLKGVKIPLKRSDTQTTLQFDEIPRVSRITPTVSLATQHSPSTCPNDNNSALPKPFSSGLHTPRSASDAKSMEVSRKLKDVPGKYGNIHDDKEVEGGNYCGLQPQHADSVWYVRRSSSCEDSVSGLTMSDTNTIHSSMQRGKRYGKEYSFDHPEDLDTRSAYSWRSQYTDEYTLGRDHADSKQIDSGLLALYGDDYSLGKHDHYGTMSKMDDDCYPVDQEKHGRYGPSLNYHGMNGYYDAPAAVYGGYKAR